MDLTPSILHMPEVVGRTVSEPPTRSISNHSAKPCREPKAVDSNIKDGQKKANMTSTLEQLKSMTIVVADTGDARAIRTYKPVDCTTNPSLVLAALKDPASERLLAHEIGLCRKADKGPRDVAATLTVAIGAELTKFVPGRVSTEVDPCLSFDCNASVRRARDIIADYGERGVSADRVLIKLAATWEGIRAAEILQREGIDCNLTLLFSMPQAIACADAGVFLISPFVGRITDWYKKADGKTTYAPDEDPGVRSVRTIYNYYKANGIRTIVMGASFRNLDQIKALAGCDRLTIVNRRVKRDQIAA